MNKPELSLHDSPSYDEALLRLEPYGVSCLNGFTSHAPMAVEALCRLQREDAIGPFLDAYIPGLKRAEAPEPPLVPGEREGALGRNFSYSSWLSTFREELRAHGAREVAEAWLPRLAVGCVAGAFHGPLMASHAFRGIELRATAPRLEAVARGLAARAYTSRRYASRAISLRRIACWRD
ncbi:MAG: hypothetical protein AAF449_18665 [Myxococcota bacterium]